MRCIVGLCCALALLVTTPASAYIVDTTGEVAAIPPPPDLTPDQAADADVMFVMDERQGVPLPAGLNLVLDVPGETPADVGPGTLVDCHLVHADLPADPGAPTNATHEGTVTFSGEIVGLIVFPEELAATDMDLGLLGAGVDAYGTESERAWDFGLDSAMIIGGDRRELQLHTQVDILIDELRVLTIHTPAMPDAGPPDADVGVPPTDTGAPPDTGTGSEGTTFRGTGGCACRTTPGGAPPGCSLLLLTLVFVRRRRHHLS